MGFSASLAPGDAPRRKWAGESAMGACRTSRKPLGARRARSKYAASTGRTHRQHAVGTRTCCNHAAGTHCPSEHTAGTHCPGCASCQPAGCASRTRRTSFSSSMAFHTFDSRVARDPVDPCLADHTPDTSSCTIRTASDAHTPSA